MALSTNILDISPYEIRNLASQALLDTDVFYWNNHTSVANSDGNASYVPRYAFKEVTFEKQDVDISSITNPESFNNPTNSYLITSDYSGGYYLFSEVTLKLYHGDILSNTLVEIPQNNSISYVKPSKVITSKYIDYKPIDNCLYLINPTDGKLWRFNLTANQWSLLCDLPSDWNSYEYEKELILLIDQQSYDVYILSRNLFVVAPGKIYWDDSVAKNILYLVKAWKLDINNLSTAPWINVITPLSVSLDNFGVMPGSDSFVNNTHIAGKVISHNNKLHCIMLWQEVIPSPIGSPAILLGANYYISHIVINMINGAIERNTWKQIYNVASTASGEPLLFRYGMYIGLAIPGNSDINVLVDPIEFGVSYIRVNVNHDTSNVYIKANSKYCIVADPSNYLLYDAAFNSLYDFRLPISQLSMEYKFPDQYYINKFQLLGNNANGLDFYVDTGTGAFVRYALNYDSANGIVHATINSFMHRFKLVITSSTNSPNVNSEYKKVKLLTALPHVTVVDENAELLETLEYKNIIVGQPTEAQLVKIYNNHPTDTTFALKVYIEPDGTTGSYFTEISTSETQTFIRHCTSNNLIGCDKRLNFKSTSCAEGKCSGYERNYLYPTIQKVPPGQYAIFYVRANIANNLSITESRLSRFGNIIYHIEY